MPDIKQLLLAFLVGISFSATWITQTYVALAYHKGGTSSLERPLLVIASRVMYGLANMVLVLAGNTVQQALVIGGVLGFIMSIIGRLMGLPRTLFGLKEDDEWKVHIVTPFVYALVFATIVRFLNEFLVSKASQQQQQR